MRKVLLISNAVLHYREKVYNNFAYRFSEDGFEFHVASDSFQDVYPHEFVEHRMKSLLDWRAVLDNVAPSCVIMFLHLKDKVMLSIIKECHRRGIPVIYWNYGINIKDPNNFLKNAIFHRIHDQCDALITYTPDMVKYFKRKNRNKLFIAFNTIDLSDIDKDAYDKGAIKGSLGIKEPIVVSFISRMKDYKRPDFLFEALEDVSGVAVVFVGPGISDDLRLKIEAKEKAYYLGELYGAEVDQIYAISDAFSTPGHIGLALNQALFWGLPVFLLKGNHAPEIYYMKDGDTGFIADETEFRGRAIEVLKNPDELKRMHEASLEVYDREVSIDKMYSGFINAVNYCLG